MRAIATGLLLCSLAACAPQVPDSGSDYFDNSEQTRRAREAQLTTGTPVVPAGRLSDERSPTVPLQPAPVYPGSTNVANSANVPGATPRPNDDIAREAQAALEASSRNSGVQPLEASPDNPPPELNNPGISDEQDFAAVSTRESIQSDAERIARNQAQYQQVQPTAVPSRPGNSQPNIVAYALSTSHARGTKVYSRAGINMAARAQRACASYTSADQAQIDFLAKGGPERDRMGVDPDGDGYACQWNPAPFRRAAQN